MEKPLGTVRLLYTADIRGDEAALTGLLPRLYNLIRRLKSQHPGGPTLLLDLGGACWPDVWPCDVTGGRSTLLVLDAMGYDAANASTLSPENRDKLSRNMMQMALVYHHHDWHSGGVRVTCHDADNADFRLHVILKPHDTTRLVGSRFYPGTVHQGQLGFAQIDLQAEKALLVQDTIFDLPLDTLPDPTIAGAVDFVLSEARRFQKPG